MEKTIFIQTDENRISTAEIELLAGALGGIILVKQEDKIIGSVIYDSKYVCWHVETFYDKRVFETLRDLIVAFPEYKFIYLEE